MKKIIMGTVWTVFVILLHGNLSAQKSSAAKTTFVAWEGMIIAGYVNHGGYVNFGGPSIKVINKPWSIGFGILPTMRIKEDNVPKGAMKNSKIIPTAGFGFTIVYKHLVLQVPFYYNAKTTTANGKWFPGIGIGFKL